MSGFSRSNLAVCIGTRNRPRQLRRLLSSMLPFILQLDGNFTIVVADQSDSDRFSLNSIAVEEFQSKCGCGVVHFAVDDEAWDFVERWSPGIVRSRSPGASYGSFRNALALAAAGMRMICIDDDVVMTPHSLLLPEDAVDARVGWKLGAFRSRGDAALAATPVQDVLPALLDPLGSTLQGRKIVVTTPGLLGETGLAGHGQIILADTRLAQSLADTGRDIGGLMDGTRCFRCAPDRVVTEFHGFLATAYALDNASPRCPFIPEGRGEDQVWSAMLRAVEPDGGLLHLPFVLLHPRRSIVAKQRFVDLDAVTFPLSLLLASFHGSIEHSGNEALLELGERMAEFFSADRGRLAEHMCGLINEYAVYELARLNSASAAVDLESPMGRLWSYWLLKWEWVMAQSSTGALAGLFGEGGVYQFTETGLAMSAHLKTWPALWTRFRDLRTRNSRGGRLP